MTVQSRRVKARMPAQLRNVVCPPGLIRYTVALPGAADADTPDETANRRA
jgi:hypothetical protein